jgi:hypothetical protein
VRPPRILKPSANTAVTRIGWLRLAPKFFAPYSLINGLMMAGCSVVVACLATNYLTEVLYSLERIRELVATSSPRLLLLGLSAE